MIYSASHNNDIALQRIKRLASSGLRVEPLVRLIFENVELAVPHSPYKSFNFVNGDFIESAFYNTPEIFSIASPFRHFYIESPSNLSGSKVRFDAHTLRKVLPGKAVWHQEELALPDFYRTDGYNVVFRPVGWDHLLVYTLAEAGEYLGYYPIWRTAAQPPFNREEITFLKHAAPHIAHGLKAAELLTRENQDSDSFAPLPGWGLGAILLDGAGKIVAIDSVAKSMFMQTAIFDGISTRDFESVLLKGAVDYIFNSLKRIFSDPKGIAVHGSAPVYSINQHWTGVTFRLRGIRMTDPQGREYFSILVERGETPELRARCAMLRWGLSPREAEVLSFVAQGKSGPEISTLLDISHDTARKHLGRIYEKLGVENRTAAASTWKEAADGIDLSDLLRGSQN